MPFDQPPAADFTDAEKGSDMERETVIDIETTDESIVSDSDCGAHKTVLESSGNNIINCKREKRKSTSTPKKPSKSKPPRPPRGLSLDAFDQKLIKEISDLAVIRRARIQRMKALKKAKAAKKASFNRNLIAMVFTVVFCIFIIFQGCHSSRIYHGNKLGTSSKEGSPKSKDVAVGDINMMVQLDQRNFSTSDAPLTRFESPML